MTVPPVHTCRSRAAPRSIVAGGVIAAVLLMGTGGAASPAVQGDGRRAPPATIAAQLAAISCPSPAYCVAAGNAPAPYLPRARAFVLQWRHGSWSRLALPRAAQLSTLAAVDCWASDQCAVVGSRRRAAEVLYWNGRRWLEYRRAVAGVGGEWTYTSVSCFVGGACNLVGEHYPYNATGFPSFVPMLAVWSPARGAIRTIEGAPHAPDDFWASISCTYRACFISSVRQGLRSQHDSLLEVLHDSVFKRLPPRWHKPIGRMYLSCMRLSCQEAGAANGCAEVSSFHGRWSRPKCLPQPESDFEPQLAAISCWGAVGCIAVGSAYCCRGVPPRTYAVPLAERLWSGRWTRVSQGLPASSQLTSVACPNGRACFAVGYESHGKRQVALAARWDGSKWTKTLG